MANRALIKQISTTFTHPRMQTRDIIEQYSNTQDHDLRYMSLRQNALEKDVEYSQEELSELVSRVLIPSLCDSDSSIVQLSSTQVFPHMVRCSPDLTELCLLQPLCKELNHHLGEAFEGKADHVAVYVQTIRNVLREYQGRIVSKSSLQHYIDYLGDTPYTTQLAWDALTLFLQKSDLSQEMYVQLYRLVLVKYHDVAAATNALAMATGKMDPKTVLSAIQMNIVGADSISIPNLRLLRDISRETYQFKLAYENLLVYATHDLAQKPKESQEEVELLFGIIHNLSPWLQESAAAATPGSKRLVINDLYQLCETTLSQEYPVKDLDLQMDTDDESENEEQNAYLEELGGGDYGEDTIDEQDAEMEGGIFFESDDEATDPYIYLRHTLILLSELPNQPPDGLSALIAQIPSSVLKQVKAEFIKLVKRKSVFYETVVNSFPNDIDDVIVRDLPQELLQKVPTSEAARERLLYLSTDYPPWTQIASPLQNVHLVPPPPFVASEPSHENMQQVLHSINEWIPQTTVTRGAVKCVMDVLMQAFTSEAVARDLSLLQLSLEIVSQCIKHNVFGDNNSDLLAQRLIPQLKPNKNLIKTIKVGNMKQQIDDGSTLRATTYTLLQQMSYSYSTKITAFTVCVERGLKDGSEIKELSVDLMKHILDASWPEIRIRDEAWFTQTIIPKILERQEKIFASRPNKDTATSQQLEEWSRSCRGIQRALTLINDLGLVEVQMDLEPYEV